MKTGGAQKAPPDFLKKDHSRHHCRGRIIRFQPLLLPGMMLPDSRRRQMTEITGQT
jgi:hypothetical protein